MTQYPLYFHTSATATSGIQSLWETKAHDSDTPALKNAIPPEFGGPGGGFSPEDYYALAINNCFIATFKVFAEKSNLQYQELKVEVKLTVGKDTENKVWMTNADITVTLVAPSDRTKAERLLQRVSEGCLVLNSMRTEKHFTFQVIEHG